MGGEAKRRRELAGQFGVWDKPNGLWVTDDATGDVLYGTQLDCDDLMDFYGLDDATHEIRPIIDPDAKRPGMRFVGVDGVGLQGGSAGRRGTRASLQASWRTYPVPPPRTRGEKQQRVPVVIHQEGRTVRPASTNKNAIETVTTPGTAIDFFRRDARSKHEPHEDLMLQLRQHPLAYATDEAHKGLIVRLRRRVMQKRAILQSGRRLRVHGVRRSAPPRLRAFRTVRLSELARRLRQVMRKKPGAGAEGAAPTTEAA